MGMTDELRGLQELRDAGTLTDAEFAQAKAALLSGGAQSGRRHRRATSSNANESLGAAANTWVKFQIRWAIAAAVVMLIFFFAFFLPNWNKAQSDFDRRWNEFPRLSPPTFGK